MSTSRAGLRFAQFARTHPLNRFIVRNTQRHNVFQRRVQSTVAGEATEQSGFSKFWNSQVGPKTVHFWAPIMKWALVLAGVSDFYRPAESLSLTQNLALMATGAIWTRWCFVIRPKNVFLATVNFFVFLTGSIQVSRIFSYQQSLKKDGIVNEVKEAASEQKEAAKDIVEKGKKAIKG